jgi:hypothetical protein
VAEAAGPELTQFMLETFRRLDPFKNAKPAKKK